MISQLISNHDNRQSFWSDWLTSDYLGVVKATSMSWQSLTPLFLQRISINWEALRIIFCVRWLMESPSSRLPLWQGVKCKQNVRKLTSLSFCVSHPFQEINGLFSALCLNDQHVYLLLIRQRIWGILFLTTPLRIGEILKEKLNGNNGNFQQLLHN